MLFFGITMIYFSPNKKRSVPLHVYKGIKNKNASCDLELNCLVLLIFMVPFSHDSAENLQ